VFRKKETMRIPIALDATPLCAAIVKEAAVRPWPCGSRFFLLRVLDPFRFVKAPISLQRAKDAAHFVLKNLTVRRRMDHNWDENPFRDRRLEILSQGLTVCGNASLAEMQ
jgi:hypothetical protein